MRILAKDSQHCRSLMAYEAISAYYDEEDEVIFFSLADGRNYMVRDIKASVGDMFVADLVLEGFTDLSDKVAILLVNERKDEI